MDQIVLCFSGQAKSIDLVVTAFNLRPYQKIASLTMSALSSTFSSVLLRALIEERHFALVDGLRVSNLGSL